EIAGIAMDLHASADVDLSGFDARARRYSRAGGPPNEVISVRRCAPEHAGKDRLPIAQVNPDHSIEVEIGGGHMRLLGPLGRSWIWVSPTAQQVTFENMLRVVVSRRVLQMGGAVFHAAGLDLRGSGIAFPGVSGAGKSTLTLRHAE